MKKLATFIITVLLATMFLSCTKDAAKSGEEMINPGDRIGDALITTGEKQDIITYFTFVHCPLNKDTETCTVPVGTMVNVSNAIYDPDPNSGQSLDELWSEFAFEMVIEGRPVDLPAFGWIDVKHPIAGVLRHWNVVLISDQPGQVTTKFTGELEGEPVEGTFVVIYEEP